MSACTHSSLNFTVPKHAKRVAFKPPSKKTRIAAARPSRPPGKLERKPAERSTGAAQGPLLASTFPAPLVFPDGELAEDPDFEPQDFNEWLQGSYRNPVTPDRRTIYFVLPPDISGEVPHISQWRSTRTKTLVTRPDLNHVVDYLRAFYHGMSVKLFNTHELSFQRWEDQGEGEEAERFVALCMRSEAIRIRTRSTGGSYGGQLNLKDLLDVAMCILPEDAYAILMIVEHDLYEDDDDDFCCGRAYGGSRVAVVSTARYIPNLDGRHGVETQHLWPASHCCDYIAAHCDSDTAIPPPNKKQRKEKQVAPPRIYDSNTAMGAAVASLDTRPVPSGSDARAATNVWLGRICKTASHELGHCFGVDHCSYYACIMQSSANLPEDARQPPYLCPVDLAKILHATGASASERYQALRDHCQRFPQDRFYGSFAAWLSVRLKELSDG